MKLKDLNTNLTETDLCKIGKTYKTDKPGNGYTRVYYRLFEEFKDKTINIFEIGVYFGASLKMWEEFFRNGKVYGIDNGRMVPGANIQLGKNNTFMSADDVKLMQPDAILEHVNYSWIENEKIKCYTADQRSPEQLQKALEYFNCENFDVILDDGQHFQEHQQKSLGILFPFINPGGYYIIEDVITHSSLIVGNYWGQKRKDATDCTDYVFSNFIKTGNLNSIYISKEQRDYIVNNLEDIFLFDDLNKNNSPISGTSKLLILKKKK